MAMPPHGFEHPSDKKIVGNLSKESQWRRIVHGVPKQSASPLRNELMQMRPMCEDASLRRVTELKRAGDFCDLRFPEKRNSQDMNPKTMNGILGNMRFRQEELQLVCIR